MQDIGGDSPLIEGDAAKKKQYFRKQCPCSTFSVSLAWECHWQTPGGPRRGEVRSLGSIVAS